MDRAIVFLSDYGLEDPFVGTCHAVIARIAPAARVIDLTHGIGRHAVLEGASVLRNALAYLPDGGIVLAVVDPEVGTERRAVAVRSADGRLWVGPDNGLLALGLAAAGGATEAVDIGRSPHRLEPVAATFHGRDVFAPVAAALAAGAGLAEAGDPIPAAELAAVELDGPRRDGERLIARAVEIDRFGNVQLDAGHEDLAGTRLRLGRAVLVGGREAVFARTFADAAPGQLLLYEDAWRRLALAINRGDAARELGIAPGAEVALTPGAP